jgi:hypothetical protein
MGALKTHQSGALWQACFGNQNTLYYDVEDNE